MAATPTSTCYDGSLTVPIGAGIPKAEQTTIQDEVNQLLSQIEAAHEAINAISGMPSAPTNQVADQYPIGTGVRTARERISALVGRLDDLYRYTGQV